MMMIIARYLEHKLFFGGIVILVYISFETIIYLFNTCGVCHPVGHLIAFIYLIINYFVFANSYLFKRRIEKNKSWRWLVLGISIILIIIYLIVDLLLALEGVTVEGGLF